MKRTKLVLMGILTALTFGVSAKVVAKLVPPTPKASQGTYATYVKLTWGKVSGASGYYVMRGTSSSYAKSSQLKKITSGGTTSYSDTSAVNGKTYYYWICPYKDSTKYCNTGAYAKGWIKKVEKDSMTLSATSVSAGKTVYIYYKKGSKYAKPSSIKFSTSVSGCGKVYTYSRLSSNACGYIETYKSGTVTVKVGSLSAKLTIKDNGKVELSGLANLTVGYKTQYVLKINGKPATDKKVYWSVSRNDLILSNSGNSPYAYVTACGYVKSGYVTFSVKAKYNGKTYTKNVKMQSGGSYGKRVYTGKPQPRQCSKCKTWYDLRFTASCPYCSNVIRWK